MHYDLCILIYTQIPHRENVKSHLQRETDVLAKQEEFKKDFSDLEEQLELITSDSMSLENSFDELHQLYVKQKAVHQCLLDRNKVIQQYMAELKSWTREDGGSKEEMQQELHEMEQRLVMQMILN
jgi:kynurenine formamidase